MGADENVSFAFSSLLSGRFLLSLRAKAREQVDVCRKSGKSLSKGLKMLVGKHRRRRKYCNLTVIHHGLERSPHSDLGLSVANIADDQPVHRRRRFHILFDVSDRGRLIGRQVVWERIFKLELPWSVGGERMSADKFSLSIQAKKLVGHIAHRAFCFGLCLLPAETAEPVERGLYPF